MAVKQLTETPVHTMYARRTEIRMGKNPTHVKQNPRFILRVPSAYLRYSNCLQSEQFMGVVSLKICRLYQFLSMRWKLLLKMSGKKLYGHFYLLMCHFGYINYFLLKLWQDSQKGH